MPQHRRRPQRRIDNSVLPRDINADDVPTFATEQLEAWRDVYFQKADPLTEMAVDFELDQRRNGNQPQTVEN